MLPMFPLGDQPEMARQLAARGVALALDATSEVAALRAAIETLLGDGRYRDAAPRLGAALRKRDGAEVAADALQRLLAS